MKRKIVFRLNILLVIFISLIFLWPNVNQVDAFDKENEGGSFSARTFLVNIAGNISEFFDSLLHHTQIKKENSYLVVQNIQLQALKDENIRVKKENDILREALALKKDEAWELLLVDIVGRPSLNFSQELILNKGKNDGLEMNQAVLWLGKSLVGEIKRIEEGTSFVRASTDSEFRASAFVGSDRLEAIFKGRGLKKPSLEMISTEANVSIGEVVFTSALDQKFPRGLFLGKIGSIRKTEGKSFLEIEVEPAFNWDELEQVLVIR